MFRLLLNKDKIIASVISVLAVFFSVLIIQANAQSASRNSSISFKKDSNNLFIITVRDPQGIKEFSLQPPGKWSYGGLIVGYPTSRTVDNVLFGDPTDFTPAMAGYVVDCSGNKDEFEIPPQKNGVTSGARVGAESETPSAPAPTPSAVPPSGGGSAGEPVSEPAPKLNVNYPVAELGNCGSEFECRVYCDK